MAGSRSLLSCGVQKSHTTLNKYWWFMRPVSYLPPGPT